MSLLINKLVKSSFVKNLQWLSSFPRVTYNTKSLREAPDPVLYYLADLTYYSPPGLLLSGWDTVLDSPWAQEA